jgi:hypothetical protein
MLAVDAANVVGSRPTGWWRDRAGAARRLYDAIAAAAQAGDLPLPVLIVLEGQARAGVAEGESDGVRVLHAAGSGDDEIARVVSELTDDVTVVTADRGLRARVGRDGVTVVGPGWLLERLPTYDG